MILIGNPQKDPSILAQQDGALLQYGRSANAKFHMKNKTKHKNQRTASRQVRLSLRRVLSDGTS